MKRKRYQRISKEDKEKIKCLVLKGKSLREISKILDVGITTIYYNTRKFRPRRKEKFVANLTEEKLGELMGAFAGDGSYYVSKHGRSSHHKVRYSLSLSKDLAYSEYLIDLLKNLKLNPFLIKNVKGGAIEVLVNSKDYSEFIRKFLSWENKKTYSVRLKHELASYDDKFLIGFARGLMDTDGFVEVSNVSCGCVSEQLIKNLGRIFDRFGIRYKMSRKIREPKRKDLFLVRVYRESLKDYFGLIGFSNRYKFDALNKILEGRWGRQDLNLRREVPNLES
nr:hypothetical protein [uncultured archaeon]AQS31822.1 hypothetical protein [uncultured archaeon]